jgi:hypothetical protein
VSKSEDDNKEEEEEEKRTGWMGGVERSVLGARRRNAKEAKTEWRTKRDRGRENGEDEDDDGCTYGPWLAERGRDGGG